MRMRGVSAFIRNPNRGRCGGYCWRFITDKFSNEGPADVPGFCISGFDVLLIALQDRIENDAGPALSGPALLFRSVHSASAYCLPAFAAGSTTC